MQGTHSLRFFLDKLLLIEQDVCLLSFVDTFDAYKNSLEFDIPLVVDNDPQWISETA